MSSQPMSQAAPVGAFPKSEPAEEGAPAAPAPPTHSGPLRTAPPAPGPAQMESPVSQRSMLYAQQGQWWLYIIERFGFPTLVCCALGYILYQNAQDERISHREERAAVVKQLGDLNEGMAKQSRQLEDVTRALGDVKDVLKERLPRGRQ